MSFKVIPLVIVLTPVGKQKVAEATLDQIREQAAAGISSTGEQTPYDWRETGRLLSDVSITPAGELVFNAPYAEHVEAARPFAGIAPQSQADFERKLQPVLDAELTFESEK
jgi:hypothetical protein